jgi:hypothetical protein
MNKYEYQRHESTGGRMNEILLDKISELLDKLERLENQNNEEANALRSEIRFTIDQYYEC